MYYYFTPTTEYNFMFNQMIPVFQNILSEIIDFYSNIIKQAIFKFKDCLFYRSKIR